MQIEYVTGNLFEHNPRWVAHCANAMGRMGSGFAKELRERYPDNYDTYRAAYDRSIRLGGSFLPLGDVIEHEADDGVTILNIIGQKAYGYDGKQYVSYDALVKAFIKIDEMFRTIDGEKIVSMPLLGASLAGGRWPIISSIIETYSTNYKPVVYLLDGKIPK